MIVANKVKLLKRSHLICHKEQTRLKEKKKLRMGSQQSQEKLAAAVEGKLYEIKCI